jgi:outer membrane protein
MEPFVRQAYQGKQCAILLDRQAVQLANPAMDITQQVVTGLNGKIQQFAFDRERLDTAPTTAQGAPPPTQTPARPAAQTPAPAKR